MISLIIIFHKGPPICMAQVDYSIAQTSNILIQCLTISTNITHKSISSNVIHKLLEING